MARQNKTVQTPKEPKLPFRNMFRFDISPERKSLIIKVSALMIFVFAVFSLIASISYLFTWKADQSLLSELNHFSQNVEVSNGGGKLGYMWGRFLIADSFGLAGIVWIGVMFWGAFRMFFKKDETESPKFVKVAFMSLAGTFLLSLLFAFLSHMLSADTWLEGGLGGFMGAAVVVWMENLIGLVPAILLVLLMSLIWGLAASRKVAVWLEKVSSHSFGNAKEAEPVVEEEKSPENEETVADGDDMEDKSEDMSGGPFYEVQQDDMEPEAEIPRMDPVSPEENIVLENLDEGVEKEMDIIRGEGFSTEVTEELPWIDNRSDLDRYEFPSLDLLNDYADGYHEVSQEELECNNNKIRTTLLNYKIKIDKVTAIPGPTVTLYKIIPSPGVKISSIRNVEEDIAISLKARGVRVVKLEDAVGIEVANKLPSIVPLKSMLNDEAFRNSKAELPVAIGYTITQKVKTFDLADAPHLLIAGATKQGKSVGLNVIISSLLYRKHPSELKLVFIDPKMVEFSAYKALLKHYLAVLPTAASEEDEAENAIVKQPKQAEQILNSLCVEMDERYKLLSTAGVNNIKLYNEKYKSRHLNPNDGHKFLPYIVVVIDEYADLTMSGGPGGDAKAIARNVTNSIVRLAQKGRAAGLHVIIATQRPTVNVVTGLIKTNFPTRIAFRVVSRVDSSTILDAPGAENLIGKGDMLYYAGVEMERVQCALVSMDEINKITKYIGSQQGYHQCYNTPYYLPMPETADGDGGAPGMIDMQNVDPLFEDAAKMVVMSQKGSTSDLQRRLGMGYARAGRVMDQLEAAGVVGPQEGSKPRQVLVTTFDELSEIISAFIQ